jgi:hypothetical protein
MPLQSGEPLQVKISFFARQSVELFGDNVLGIAQPVELRDGTKQ